MGASASVIQEYYKAVDYWADIVGNRDWKLSVWIVGQNDVDLVDRFLEIERSPVGQFDDIFFRFDTPYRGDDEEYTEQLWQEYAGWFSEKVEEKYDILRALRHDGLLKEEYIPDVSVEHTAGNLWREMLRFKACISRLDDAFFCLYFPPEQERGYSRTGWFGNVLKEGVPQGIRMTTIDLKKNSENLLEFTRDRKTGLITEERQGEYTVSRTYDGEGNCTRITSSLGADIRHTYDREGNLQAMQAGESWQASWVRDNTGLEVQRIFSGGVTVSTERDRFGCEVRKSVRSGGIERGAYRYEWGIANRLLSKENELTGTVMRYDYDRFDFLIRQETTQGSETDVIYRVPDFVGNLFGTPDRKDRKYGAGGKLLEDPDCFYHYDDEGNLIFREFKQLQETGVRYDRKRMEKERDIRCLATGTGWLYEWASNGMLKNVIRPDGRPVEFRYDALGRRTAKLYFGKVTRWVWDGNVPLHEWITTATDNDVLPNRNNITTWIFEEETLIPTAKIQSDKSCSIVSDYLGTPIQMYDGQGNKTWDCTLDIYGKVIDFTGKFLYDCPFRFQGQYEDAETGLYYNRFRYYSAEIGCYLTHDPIGLAGGILIYGYVSNPNSYIDPSGESSYRLGKNLEKNGMNHGGKVTFGPNGNRSTEWQAHHIIPEQVWRRNNVFFKEIGLRGRDSASNGVFLPNSKEVSSKNSLQYFHCGSHPDYNVTVDKEIKKIEAMYEFEKNNIKPDIAKANAINRIRNLQNDFRQKMSAYYTGEPASINNFH